MRFTPARIEKLALWVARNNPDEFSRRDALDLIAERFEVERHRLLLESHRVSWGTCVSLLWNLWKLKRGMPFAYLTGKVFFYDSEFVVNRQVLIPRKETEQMMDLIVEKNLAGSAETILDVGTGSGVLAISLKKKYPEKTVLAVDLSSGALKVARENARRILGDENAVEWGNFDFFDKVKRSKFLKTRKIELLVSNPPYVAERERPGLDNALSYEPELALFAGEDGLEFYRSLAVNIKNLLPSGARFCLEMGESQAQEVSQMMEYQGERNIIRDTSGRERFFFGQIHSHPPSFNHLNTSHNRA